MDYTIICIHLHFMLKIHTYIESLNSHDPTQNMHESFKANTQI
jgi:hypothetical protein